MEAKTSALFCGFVIGTSGILDLLEVGVGIASLAALKTKEDAQTYNQTVASGSVSVKGYIPKKDPAHRLLPLFSRQVAERERLHATPKRPGVFLLLKRVRAAGLLRGEQEASLLLR